MARNIRIESQMSLGDLEALICEVRKSDAEVYLWLPRSIGAQLFKASSVARLIATVASNRRLSVIDWIEEVDLSKASERFSGNVEGLASLVYAEKILNAKKRVIDLNMSRIIWTIIQREGIAEAAAHGASLTLCAFDEDDKPSIPIAFVSMDTKEKFSQEFVKYRRKYFEVGAGEGYSEKIQPNLFDVESDGDGLDARGFSHDHYLAHFVFEIFQNTFEHGCKDKDGYVVRGLRYINIQKHISHNRDEFIKRATDFYELGQYLEQRVPNRGTFSFYEISISDYGLGIINRFVASRPDLNVVCEGAESQAKLINQILAQALSSKRAVSGAGHGLKRALTAVRNLGGFVSFRTNNCWLYYTQDSAPTAKASVELLPVTKSEALPGVAGTHVNMLFPLS